MRSRTYPAALLGALGALAACLGPSPAPPPRAEPAKADPLPSWRDGKVKKALLRFVTEKDRNSKKYVRPQERIATFDKGTLWSEKPFYFQLAFALDSVKALAGKHPEWKKKQAFKA